MTTVELIKRLEAATGPHPDLDAGIAVSVGVKHRSRRDSRGRSKGREWLDDSHGGVETWLPHPPRYTSSLDAAYALLPTNHEWHGLERNVQWDDPEVFSGPEREYGVQIYGMTEAGYPDVKRDFHGAHDLLPIALCIAALRARTSNSIKSPMEGEE